SDRELAAATQRRDSINAQLANVRQMLVTLTGSAPVALMDESLAAPDAEAVAAEEPAAETPAETPDESQAETADEARADTADEPQDS
ncbi:MAG: hypothetical protein WBQ50_21905, partial [Nocardioides sp.]